MEVKEDVMKAKVSKEGGSILSDRLSLRAKKGLANCAWLILAMVLISLLVNLCIRIDSIYLNLTISEFSVTELTQIILLSITFSVFLLMPKKNAQIYHATLLFAGFFAVVTIRELDHWFDMIEHGFWLYPALLVSSIAIFKAVAGGKRTINEMAFLIERPYFKLMLASVILLLVFSRVYGMGSFWRAIMDENYIRDVKNISEEGIELLCYSLICFSSVMIYKTLPKLNKST